jgi:hypothetical protein
MQQVVADETYENLYTSTEEAPGGRLNFAVPRLSGQKTFPARGPYGETAETMTSDLRRVVKQ